MPIYPQGFQENMTNSEEWYGKIADGENGIYSRKNYDDHAVSVVIWLFQSTLRAHL